MRNGKLKIILLAVLCVFSAGIGYGADVGKAAKNPITFEHVTDWMRDSRRSLNLFEQTLRTDYIAVRYNVYFAPGPYYVMMDDGRVYQTSMTHSMFQGMFWGPLFSAFAWEAAVLPFDLLLTLLVGSPVLSYIPLGALVASLGALQAQGQTEVPMSGVFHINVVFTSDLMLMDLRKYDNVGYASERGASALGRTYAGMCFKVAEVFNLFFGFNLIHFPHMYGWQEFVTNEPGFADQDAVTATSGRIVDETRVKLLLYNNVFDLLQFRALFNLDAEEALDMMGIGLVADILKRVWDFWVFDLNMYLSYLKMLDKLSWDFSGTIPIKTQMVLFYDYQLSIRPFDPLDYLKIGVSFKSKGLYSENIRILAFQFRAYGLTYQRYGQRLWGFAADMGLSFLLSTQLQFGVSYNADETMQQMPFSMNDFVFSFKFEIGMDRNFDYRLRPVVKRYEMETDY